MQDEGTVKAVDGVSFDVQPRATLGIVGESGCGKSITARSILGIVDRPGRVESGEIWLDAGGARTDLAQLAPDSAQLRAIRGKEIALIFQEPMASFSHYYTVGNQIMEGIRQHSDATHDEAHARAIELLRIVGVPQPERRVDEYPFQLSGGLRQRVMIAMVMMCNPDLIIADEPTTALDVTIQAQILLLLAALRKEFGMGLILITHDLGIVARIADRVAVMYAGQIVEEGSVQAVFRDPLHPYTRGLMNCIPVPGKVARGSRLGSIPGMVPSLIGELSGCSFRERCDFRRAECEADIALRAAGAGHARRCIL
jgi:peptide/nickel transport system ATP-binding protein